MIIDFHTHIFPPEIINHREKYLEKDVWFRLLYENPKARMATAEELIAALDEAQVDKAVAFGFAWHDAGLCRMTNDYVLEAMDKYPDRVIGFAQVQPNSREEAIKETKRCLSKGMRGVGEMMPNGQGFHLDNEELLAPLIAVTVAHNAVMMIHTSEPVGHTYCGKGTISPASVYRLALKHPELTIVCCHWGGGLPFYELMPEVRAALRNVYYDTAASLYLYDDHIFPLVLSYIPNKVMFATDYALITPKRFLRRVRDLDIPDETLQKFLGGNAQRLLALRGFVG